MLFSFFFFFCVKAMDMVARQTTKLTNKAQAKISFQLFNLSNELQLYGYTFSITMEAEGTRVDREVAECLLADHDD